ncbi:MAG: thioredoxin family protein [Candidatus Kariarchaeaceae archaeon]|jgi:peroxiredoxin
MTPLPLGSNPIPFSLPGTDGNTHDLTQYNDSKYLAIMFSCNHCPYVVASEREFVEIQQDFANDGFQLIAISSNETENYPQDSFENMKKRADEKNFNFPYLFDENQEIAIKYGATRTPEIFLFNEARKLVYHGRINDNPKFVNQISRHDLRETLTEVVAGKEITMPQNQPIGCTIKWKPE